MSINKSMIDRTFRKNNRAFTILELLVVISVLAILIGIGIPRVKAMVQNGNAIKAKKEVATLKAALESYITFDSSRSYPPTTTTLQASYLVNAVPNMINNILYDPFGATSTTEYNYMLSGNGKYYVVWTVGLPGVSQPTAISNTGDITY